MNKSLILLCFTFYIHCFGQQNLLNNKTLPYENDVPKVINSLKQKNPTAANLVELGNLYFTIENFRNALKYYESALSIKQEDELIYKIALVNEKLGRYYKALNHYKILWQKDSLNTFLTYRISKLQIRMGAYTKAKKHLKYLINKDSTHPVYPYKMGLIHSRKDEYDSAIDYFLKAFEIDSTYIDVIYQLAKSFDHLRIKDSTDLFIKSGLNLDPDHKNLNRIKINKLRRDKKYEAAIKILLKQDSLYPLEYYNAKMLGICNFNSDRYEEAKKWFKVASKIDPEDYDSNTYLGHILFEQKQFEKALIQYLIATRKGRNLRDEEYLGLGHCYLELADLPNAIKMFQRAFDENGGNHNALFELAFASDRYYANKKIGYKKYQQYVKLFNSKKDTSKLKFIKSRMGAIKEKLFLAGEILD